MVKVRMNTADVAAEVRCLRKLIGMRCANVYDLSAKIYMFKLMRSSGVTESGESEKNLLLIESGVRLHTTAFARDKSMTPSGFTLKLRKHIRTKRLEDVRQLGIDRIVDFQFGLGESAHHIILELYSQGNVLLTDADYTVLTLLRTHRDDEKHLTMMVRHQYPIDSSRLFEKTSIEKLEMWLLGQKISKGSVAVQESSEKHDSGINTSSKGQLAGNGEANVKDIQVKEHGKKTDSGGGKGDKVTLKTVLGERLGYGPALSEHIVLDVGLSPNMKVSSENDKGVISPSKEQIEVLYAAVMRFEAWLEDIVSGEQIPRGYIIMQSKGVKKQQTPSLVDGQCKMYDDFSPIMLNQFKGRELIETETFDAAMDEFFSKIEGQRAEQQRKAQEESALSKLDKIRKDQASRVEVLKKEVDQSVHMAELIEYNLEDVDSAILAVRTALAMGMDWNDLARMVKEERKAGNPVAGLIHSLHLEKNQITLLLSNNLDDMDEEEKTLPVDKVDVDLALSAYANARRWFEMKKRQANKQEKTELAHEKALKAAEKKTQQQLSQAKTVAAISHLRKVHWFEKFNWFISSENYLIISGRDAQQNELVVKRYLKKGDLYVHADLHGASSTVIKNHNPDHPVPPLTLNQAGCFTVCRSQAWDSKIVTSAWWVYAHQVSKTAPTGEYLTAGSFMIRGRKNFLPPHPLVMGFGILFKLDESSIAAHLNERKIRGEGEEDDVESQDVYEEVQMDTVDESDEIVQNSIDVMNPIDVNALQITGTIEVFDELSRRELAISVEENEEEHTSGISEYIERRGESFKKVVNDSEEYAIKEENKASLDKMESQSTEEFDELMDKALELSLYPKLSKQGKKYGLADYSKVAEKDRLEDGASVEGASGKVLQRERPYLSKVDRRKLKKGANDVDDKKDINTKHESIETTLKKASQQVETFMPNETFKEASGTGRDETRVEAAGKIGRGRKGKLKKIKEKYAEQDDEERELRMALLASAGKSESKLAGRAASKKDKGITAKLPKVENPDNGKVDSSKICYKCKRSGHIARDCSVAVSDLNDLQGEGAIESNDGGTLLREEEMEKIALMTEENILDLGEDEKEKLTELDSLTGSPLSDDILLYAVPVCGPYSALQGYKYRVKITPGTSKRGKAAKTAINLFIHMQDMSPREKELLKAITDPELVAAFISNAKVTAPGLTQLKQRQKKGKKALVGEE